MSCIIERDNLGDVVITRQHCYEYVRRQINCNQILNDFNMNLPKFTQYIPCQFPNHMHTGWKPKIRLKTDCSEKDHWIEFHTDSIQETPWNGNEVKTSVYKGA